MNSSFEHIKSSGERWLRQQLLLFSDEFQKASKTMGVSETDSFSRSHNRYQVAGLQFQLQHCRAFYPEDQEMYLADKKTRARPVLRKQCYYNAQMLALDDPGLSYYEGFYVTDNLPFPINHGFCVRKEKGHYRLIDPTVEEFGIVTLEWYGMLIPRKYWQNRISETGYASAVLYPYITEQIKASNIVPSSK